MNLSIIVLSASSPLIIFLLAIITGLYKVYNYIILWKSLTQLSSLNFKYKHQHERCTVAV